MATVLKELSSGLDSKLRVGSIQSFILCSTRGPFFREKRPESEEFSPPPLLIAEFNKAWISTCIPTYVFMRQFLKMYKKIIHT
jgi:hypothetical protein